MKKNSRLWKRIVKDFYTKDSIGYISCKYNVRKSIIINIWKDEFGISSIKERDNLLFPCNLECPVCGVKGNKEFISRHIMNSRKEEKHNLFTQEQDEKIKEIYRTISDKDLDPYKISENLYCSGSYIRKIFHIFDDYKQRSRNRRKIDTAKQYKDGRRDKPKTFNNNWKLTRENGGKRFINEEKINKIYELYHTNLTQKEISKIVKCKESTVNKYLIKNFGKNEVSVRNMKTKINKISKINIDMKITLRDYFFKRFTKLEIAEKLNISKSSVLGYFKKVFSKSQRKEREKDIQKKSISKSLRICGKKGITGSLPETLCFNLLKENLDCEIIHHDINLIPPYEIDISIPSKKIAISWDGIFHRKPIFGNDELKKVIIRDKNKEILLVKNGWKLIKIEDNDSKININNIANTVTYILGHMENKFRILRIINGAKLC